MGYGYYDKDWVDPDEPEPTRCRECECWEPCPCGCDWGWCTELGEWRDGGDGCR